MPTFNIELTRKIVVAMEADTEREAIEQAINDDSGFDGAWDRAESSAAVIDSDEDEKANKKDASSLQGEKQAYVKSLLKGASHVLLAGIVQSNDEADEFGDLLEDLNSASLLLKKAYGGAIMLLLLNDCPLLQSVRITLAPNKDANDRGGDQQEIRASVPSITLMPSVLLSEAMEIGDDYTEQIRDTLENFCESWDVYNAISGGMLGDANDEVTFTLNRADFQQLLDSPEADGFEAFAIAFATRK